MLQGIGFFLAIFGMIFTIVGTLINNLQNRHRVAMKIWGISNPMLLSWAGGFLLGFWTADLGMYAVFISYLVMTVSNWYGLLRFRGRGLP